MSNRKKSPTTPCKAPDCDKVCDTKRGGARGFCPQHYQQVRRHNRLTPEREHDHGLGYCRVDKCEGEPYSRNLCLRHYKQQRREAQRAKERWPHFG